MNLAQLASLQKDIDAFTKKHGLKADDADNDKVDGADESDNAGDAGDKKPENKTSEVHADIGNLTQQIAKQIVDAVQLNKGYNEADKQSLDSHVNKEMKTKIFTKWGGVQEVEYPTSIENLTKEEKICTFFKALFYHKVDPRSDQVLKALVEGTDSEGGYLVPEELRTEIFRVIPDIAVMRRLAQTLPMKSDTLKLNSLTARPQAVWTGEYASKSTTSAEFGQVTLSPNDLVCLLAVSEQLLADANINLVQFIIRLFSEAIALAEDKAFFTGSGTGQPRGINQETITTIVGGGAGTFDDILSIIDGVPQRVRRTRGVAFVANRNTISSLRRLKDSNGLYIWRDGGTGPGGSTESVRLPDTLYSYPTWEQNDLPNGEIYFGDWKFYIIGDRQAISVRTTTEGGEAWRRNSMEIKAVERVDGRAVITEPFSKGTGF